MNGWRRCRRRRSRTVHEIPPNSVRNHKDFTMSTIRRNSMSAEAFASLGAGSLVPHRKASEGAVRVGKWMMTTSENSR